MATVTDTGTYSNPIDLLQKVVSFLINNGWTQDRSEAEGSLSWAATLHRGAVYVQLKAVNGGTPNNATKDGFTDSWASSSTWYGLAMTITTDAGSGLWANRNNGAPKIGSNACGVGIAMPSGAGTSYRIFSIAGGDHVVLCTERSPRVWSHMGWGVSLEKIGSYAGTTPYMFGSINGYWLSHSYSTNEPGYSTNNSVGPFATKDTGPMAYIKLPKDGTGTVGWQSLNFRETTTAQQGYLVDNLTSNVWAHNSQWGTDQGVRFPTDYFITRCSVNAINSMMIPTPIILATYMSAGYYAPFARVPHITSRYKGTLADGVSLQYGGDTYWQYPGCLIKEM